MFPNNFQNERFQHFPPKNSVWQVERQVSLVWFSKPFPENSWNEFDFRLFGSVQIAISYTHGEENENTSLAKRRLKVSLLSLREMTGGISFTALQENWLSVSQDSTAGFICRL